MSKTRINESIRSYLRELVSHHVRCDVEEREASDARHKAEKLVLAMVLDKYPPREMKLLLKWDVAVRDQCIRLQLTAGGVEMFCLSGEEKDWPLRPRTQYGCSGHIYAADAATSDAVGAWVLARKNAADALRAKHSDYLALIRHARTLEDIEAVWPLASKVRDRLNKQLPVILSDEVVARIRADVEAQKKAA